MELILATSSCDPSVDIICAPTDVNELFEFRQAIFSVFGYPVTRTVVLILLVAAIVVSILYFGLRKKAVVPGKFQTSVEAVVGFVKDGIAVEIIGEHGAKYAPWLLSIFLFILVGNAYEVTPFINFPVTSRMALPLFLAAITWVVFVIAGIKRQGFHYFLGIVWPTSVP
ncbi:MAG: F0F1 ATP synthase subunit A, partial [Acidimicrobiia bacterium]